MFSIVSPGSGSVIQWTDPWIRICIKMSRIRNTGFFLSTITTHIGHVFLHARMLTVCLVVRQIISRRWSLSFVSCSPLSGNLFQAGKMESIVTFKHLVQVHVRQQDILPADRGLHRQPLSLQLRSDGGHKGTDTVLAFSLKQCLGSGCLFRIWIFPSGSRFQKILDLDPHKIILVFLPQKIVCKLSEIWSGMFIPDTDFFSSHGSRGLKSTWSRIRNTDLLIWNLTCVIAQFLFKLPMFL